MTANERAKLEKEKADAQYKLKDVTRILEGLIRDKANGAINVDGPIGWRQNEIASLKKTINDIDYKLARF